MLYLERSNNIGRFKYAKNSKEFMTEANNEYQPPSGKFGIRLETRVKNAALVNAREQLGFSTKEAAEKMNISYCSLICYEGLRFTPQKKEKRKFVISIGKKAFLY